LSTATENCHHTTLWIGEMVLTYMQRATGLLWQRYCNQAV